MAHHKHEQLPCNDAVISHNIALARRLEQLHVLLYHELIRNYLISSLLLIMMYI